MRIYVLPCALLMLSAVPALAQSQVQPGTMNTQDAGRNAMRACMMQQMSPLREQVRAHMEQFRAANPSASVEARHAERKAFGQQIRETNRPAIEAARATCRGQVR